MKIDLPTSAWADAQQYQEEVIEAINQRRGPDSENYTLLDAADKWAFGYLGELALQIALRMQGKQFNHHWDVSGMAAGPDFSTHDIGGHYRQMEVKTASKPHHSNLAFPHAQRKHVLRSDWVVGARILSPDPTNGDPIPVNLEGWVAKNQWRDCTPQGPDGRWSVETIPIPYIQLEPMPALFDRLMAVDGNPLAIRTAAMKARQIAARK